MSDSNHSDTRKWFWRLLNKLSSRPRDTQVHASESHSGSGDKGIPSDGHGEQWDAVISNFHSALQITGTAVQGLPIPGLDKVLSAVEQLVSRIEVARANIHEKADVVRRIQTLLNLLKSNASDISTKLEQMDIATRQTARDRIKISSELQDRVDGLVKELEEITRLAAAIQRNHWLSKTWYAKQDAESFRYIRSRIVEATSDFKIQEGIDVRRLLEDIAIEARESNRQRREHQEKLAREEQEKVGLETLEKLKPSKDASYKSRYVEEKAELQPGTRERILGELMDWVTDLNPPHRVQVLHGPAGVGKTAIARALCDRLASNGYLGASFFFQRGLADCNDSNRVFPTLAYQLAHFRRELLRFIVDAATKHYVHGDSQSMSHQLHDLFLLPLSQILDKILPVGMVVDGIDECSDDPKGVVRELVRLLCRLGQDSPHLRILIITRPETPIMDAIRSLNYVSVVERDLWVDAKREEIDRDIGKYIQAELEGSSHTEEFSLLRSRPEAVQVLTQLSGGLFIYATTVARFLSQDKFYAVEVYDSLVDSHGVMGPPRLHDQLDRLYTTILDTGFRDVSADVSRMELVHQILTWFVLKISRTELHILSARQLQYVGIPSNATMDVIARLRSLVWVEGDIGVDTEMKPYHISFQEFLHDSTRCTNPKFLVTPDVGHGQIATSLMHLLSFEDTWPVGNEDNFWWMGIYAYRHWDNHLEDASYTDALAISFQTFADTHLLQYVEESRPFDAAPWDVAIRHMCSMNWMSNMPFSERRSGLRRTRRWHREHGSPSEELAKRLDDIYAQTKLEEDHDDRSEELDPSSLSEDGSTRNVAESFE